MVVGSLRKSCSNSNERNPGGRPTISNTPLQESLNKHMEDISTIAANRFLKKDKSNAFYRHDTLRACYESFPQKNQLSFTAFVKNMSRIYKKPHRKSDLCDVCEKGKSLFKDLEHEVSSLNIEEIHVVNIDGELTQTEAFLQNLKGENEHLQDYDTALHLISQIKEVQFHRNVAKMQKRAYNQMKSDIDLLKDSILIDLDFKQKIIIGDSPNMVSGEYFERQQRSLLGFGVYYYDNEIGLIRCKHFDFVSEVDCKQDAHKAITGFRFMRQLQQFKEIQKSKYIIWADCGPHFRSSEFISYIYDDLCKEQHININLNFFAEKHGKNSRDQHFSVISNYVRLESFKQKITCTQQLVEVLNNRQYESNTMRIAARIPAIESFAYVLPANPETDCLSLRTVKNLRMFYNFFSYELNGRINLTTKTFSEQLVPFQNTIDVDSRLVKKTNNRKKPDTVGAISRIAGTNENDVIASTSRNSNRGINVENEEDDDSILQSDDETTVLPLENKLSTTRDLPIDKLIQKRTKIQEMNNIESRLDEASTSQAAQKKIVKSYCSKGKITFF